MPSMSAHMAVAKRVSESLFINDTNYYKGNIIPDLQRDKIKSHYKIKGSVFYIPDIYKIEKELDLTDITNLGIYTHLLLDYYYFEEYLPKRMDDSPFISKQIYIDYDIVNKDIINYFNLDVDYLKSILKDFDREVDNKLLEKNINCLFKYDTQETKYIDTDDFIKFLEETSIKIIERIKKQWI